MRSAAASNGPASRGLPLSDYPFWADVPELVDDLGRIREIVVREAESAGGPIGNALSQYVGRPGKMLRPGFVLIGAWAGRRDARGETPDRLIQIAAAVEALHLASLIHDDVIDDADRRRGEPSLHALYGRKQAVLMGDYLLSRCFTMIAEGTSQENAVRLAAATGHLIRGEINQMFDVGSPQLSRRAYLRRIAGKTAMLFTVSLVTGATESKARRREVALLSRVGYNIGIAFQVIDDILDFTARAEALGKPVAADLRAGVYTLPVIEAVRRDERVIEKTVPPPRDEAVLEAAIHEIRRAGGFSRAREAAATYTARARRAIGELADDRQRVALGKVADKLLNREY